MQSKEQIKQYISSIPKFQSLRPTTITAMTSIAKVIQLETQSYLYHQGELADTFYIIVEGGVRLNESTSEGREVGLKVFGVGDTFGLLALSGAFPHPSSVKAIRDSIVLAFNGQDMRDIMSLHGDLAVLTIDLLIEHVHHAHNRIREMASEKVDARLAKALLKCADKFGKSDSSNAIQLDITLSQQDLANFIGTTTESVNRTLKKWRSLGLIHHTRMNISIIDPEALTSIAGIDTKNNGYRNT